MNLHILTDDKFSEGCIMQFENSYPDENIYIVNTALEAPKYVNHSKAKVYSLENKKHVETIIRICKELEISNVFIHYLNYFTAGLANLIRKQLPKVKFYWIFFGADLYSILSTKFQYSQFDEIPVQFQYLKKTEIIKISKFQSLKSRFFNKLSYLYIYKKDGYENYKLFIEKLNFFCFWNLNDFKLVQKYFKTNAKFKYFYYTDAINVDDIEIINLSKTTILINNSAAEVGNHFTIMDKLLKFNNLIEADFVFPLNYGSTVIKKNVTEVTKKNNLFHHSLLIYDFLPKQDYFNILKNVNIAFFGAKRQHAAGNIFQLLARGVKVFLREENNMLPLLKEWGFIVFSFEKDFLSEKDLGDLNQEDKIHNHNIFIKNFNHKIIDKFMYQLIQSYE